MIFFANERSLGGRLLGGSHNNDADEAAERRVELDRVERHSRRPLGCLLRSDNLNLAFCQRQTVYDFSPQRTQRSAETQFSSQVGATTEYTERHGHKQVDNGNGNYPQEGTKDTKTTLWVHMNDEIAQERNSLCVSGASLWPFSMQRLCVPLPRISQIETKSRCSRRRVEPTKQGV